MGMAASQARLLTLTARLADNELRSQTINNAKMRLAAQSAQASDEYVRALNDAQFMFRNTDINGLTQNQALNFNVLSAYSPYNTQYGVVNSAGLLLVSEADAKNFEAANGDLDKFLKNYGIGWETSYFDSDDKESISKDLMSVYEGTPYADLFSEITNDDLKEMYEKYNANRFSIESAQYKQYSQTYASELNLLTTKYLNQAYNETFDNMTPEAYAAKMMAGITSPTTESPSTSGTTTTTERVSSTAASITTTYVTEAGRSILEIMRNTLSEYRAQIGYAKKSTDIKEYIKTSSRVTTTNASVITNSSTQPVTTTLSSGEIIPATVNVDNTTITTFETRTVTNESGKPIDTIVAAYPYTTEVSTTGTTYATSTASTTITTEEGKEVEKTTVSTTGTTYATQTTYTFQIPKYEEITVFNIGDLTIELDDANSKKVKSVITISDKYKFGTTMPTGSTVTIPTPTSSTTKTTYNFGDDSVLTLKDLLNEIYIESNINGNTKYSRYYLDEEGNFATISYSKDNTYEKFLTDYISQYKNKNYFNAEKYAESAAASEVHKSKVNFENFVFNDKGKIILNNNNNMLTDQNLSYSWQGDDILDLEKFFKKEINGHKLIEYYNYESYNRNVIDDKEKLVNIFTDEFRNVINAKLIEKMIEELGEPKYTWNDSNDLSNKGNADTKAQWYTNLFNRMLKGYKTLENGLASSKEWLQHAFESGLVSMEQVDSSYNWKGIDYKNCASITEETDNSAAVARAEAKYKRAMNDIKQKDNIFDLQLRNLDTEHTAIQTEYDVVKGVMNKNIERTMKFNQSA